MGPIKKKDHEKLTDSNISKVIGLLGASPPITKKEACEILNISYNTTRLNKIIESFKEDQELIKRMKAKKRGRPADNSEIKYIIEAYMEGVALSDIAKSNYRSVAFIKSIIERVGVPTRPTGDDKYKVEYLPDECVSDDFIPNEIVWSAKYHAACRIIKKLPDEKYRDKYNCSCYDIYVFEETEGLTKGGFYASYGIMGFCCGTIYTDCHCIWIQCNKLGRNVLIDEESIGHNGDIHPKITNVSGKFIPVIPEKGFSPHKSDKSCAQFF